MTEAARWHLAQLNVGRTVAPLEDDQLKGFVDLLDPINELADNSPGFVWRLQSDDGNATSIQLTDDPLFIVNMSVWESIEALQDFAYRTAHKELLRQRRTWFEAPAEAHLVLWWVPAGTIPTTDEAMQRLDTLRRHGPSADAFTFRQPYDPPLCGSPSEV